MRESVKRAFARHLAGLVIAGIAVIPLLLSSADGRTDGPLAQMSGSVRVVDGDTIVLGNVRVRLEGIDAPETTQTCINQQHSVWRCGEAAGRQLTALIGTKPVVCDDLGPDKYGRSLGRCFAGATNLNAEMVRTGYAWAFVKYSRSYVAEEQTARAARMGIWQGVTMPAWEFRARAWAAAEPSSPNSCKIKGNVTDAGRIYHMPWSPWYEKVQMDQVSRGQAKGKRWFCSEEEAVAAGWRAALSR